MMPKTLKAILKGSNTKTASPGDVVMVQGIFLPVRKTGYQHVNDLDFNCYLEVMGVEREKKRYV